VIKQAGLNKAEKLKDAI